MKKRRCYNSKNICSGANMIMEQWKQIRMKDGGNLGKKDTITKEYMRNPIVFDDAFNK